MANTSIRPPIIAYNRGDVLFFSQILDALRYIEPIDVENNEYEVYDADGQLLSLSLDKQGKVVINPTTLSNNRRDELRTIMVEHLESIGLSSDQLLPLSLEELIRIRLGFKTD